MSMNFKPSFTYKKRIIELHPVKLGMLKGDKHSRENNGPTCIYSLCTRVIYRTFLNCAMKTYHARVSLVSSFLSFCCTYSYDTLFQKVVIYSKLNK